MSGDKTPAQRSVRERARLDRVFGDVLPDTTRDERDDDRSERSPDDWLRAQVPPHHGS